MTPGTWSAAHPPQRPVLVVNPRSGGGKAARAPAYRDAKARTLAQTAAHVLGSRAPAAGLEVVDDRGRSHGDPAVVLVSNNPYSFEPPHAPGTRPAVGQRAGETWTAKQLEVKAPAPVQAGIDGDPVELDRPLRFAIRPAALRVRISSRQATV